MNRRKSIIYNVNQFKIASYERTNGLTDKILYTDHRIEKSKIFLLFNSLPRTTTYWKALKSNIKFTCSLNDRTIKLWNLSCCMYYLVSILFYNNNTMFKISHRYYFYETHSLVHHIYYKQVKILNSSYCKIKLNHYHFFV